MPEAPITPIVNPQREPIPSGESRREKLEAMLQLESNHEPNATRHEVFEPSVDWIVELLKKTAAFIRNPSNQDSEGWVKVNDFIKKGSSAEDKAQRKSAIATLRMKYSNQYEYRQVPIPGSRVSEQIRTIK